MVTYLNENQWNGQCHGLGDFWKKILGGGGKFWVDFSVYSFAINI